jgi:hypothetical protein
VSAAYAVSQTVPPCQFSASELQKAQDSVPNDALQYDEGLVAAIVQARQERASGACGHGATATPAFPATATAPAPPPVPPLGRNSALHLGSATAASDSGWPVPIIVLVVFAGLLALTGATLSAAQLLGWDPRWVARVRHSWGEAGYRVAGIWSEFGDWLRGTR